MNIIVACTDDGGIGKNGKIPWYYPEDLKYFRRMTMGKTIIMGRKTWDSLHHKPLSGRRNIVLSQTITTNNGIEVYKTFDQIPDDVLHDSFIIGGAQIYDLALKHKLLQAVYITKIPGVYECDTFFDLTPVAGVKYIYTNI